MGAGRQRPLVLGSEGLIGRAVAAALENAFPDTVSAGHVEIDVTDRFRVESEVERLRPTMIVNCAAIGDPEACEIDPGRAALVNAEGAANAARAAAEIGARMIQFSSTTVFDGTAALPYREADAPAPLSELGRTRLEGERAVARNTDDHLIIRTSWVYGEGATSFVDAIRRQIADGGVLRAVGDRTGSPTLASDLAAALLRLLDCRQRGVVHFGNSGSCTRYDVAAAVIAVLETRGVRLQRVSAEAAGGLARRPSNEAVDTTLYRKATGHEPRDWRRALEIYLRGGAAGDAGGV